MLKSVCWELRHKFGIRSSHWPLGMSMLAIPAIKFATWFLTTLSGLANVPRIAYFIWNFKFGSIFIQNPSNLSIFYLFSMKFLKIKAAIYLVELGMLSFDMSHVNVAKNYRGF